MSFRIRIIQRWIPEYRVAVFNGVGIKFLGVDRLNLAFTAYRISGGMPEAAMKMLNNDKMGVEQSLNNILKDYAFDFVKHASPLLANRISHVWNSLPSQLAKENHKFIYQLVRPGARAREYEDALLWLQNAGLRDP